MAINPQTPRPKPMPLPSTKDRRGQAHKPVPFPYPQLPPLILTSKDEAILKLVAEYHMLTAQEITHLCYSKGSHTYARARLSALAGNTDYALGFPLYRLPFPSARGNRERIFTLGSTGRETLENLGLQIDWHFKPAKFRTYSHSYLLHDLTRNRFVVALLTWAKSTKPNLRLESRLSYKIAKQPPTVEIPVQHSILKEGKLVKIPVMTKVGVIPDGEIVVTNTSTGERLLLLLELDHNTQARERLRTHIAALLAYIKSPHFRARYRNIPYRIIYATQGLTESASQARLAYLCDFTMQFLIERKHPQDSQYFRFASIDYARLYTDAKHLLEKPAWYLPGDVKRQSPIPLFTEAPAQPQKEHTHANR